MGEFFYFLHYYKHPFTTHNYTFFQQNIRKNIINCCTHAHFVL